jgi:hypothetical protein
MSAENPHKKAAANFVFNFNKVSGCFSSYDFKAIPA